jgi:hypothetical protein
VTGSACESWRRTAPGRSLRRESHLQKENWLRSRFKTSVTNPKRKRGRPFETTSKSVPIIYENRQTNSSGTGEKCTFDSQNWKPKRECRTLAQPIDGGTGSCVRSWSRVSTTVFPLNGGRPVRPALTLADLAALRVGGDGNLTGTTPRHRGPPHHGVRRRRQDPLQGRHQPVQGLELDPSLLGRHRPFPRPEAFGSLFCQHGCKNPRPVGT